MDSTKAHETHSLIRSMGVLADFYLSREDEAVKYDTAADEFTDRCQFKGLTVLELSTLWSIMRGVDWDVALMDEFPCLLQIDGGERLIQRIPAPMVSELAGLSQERIATVTTAWAATEEISGDPADIRPVVDDLVRLSRKAGESGRGLYLWNCV